MKLARISALSLGVLTWACGRPQFPLPYGKTPTGSHQPASELLVGAARADVTPPPGVSMFGHGPEGRVSDGYWSRLYCRVFVFIPAPATPLALVTCDLSAIGMLLQRSVAARLEDVGIPASRLMLTATHTHAGPAHYLEGDFYGDFMSSRDPGFDPKMVDFLSDRISRAVRSAVHDARRARIAWSHGAVWGLTRNRSLIAFQQNAPGYLPDPVCAAGNPPADALPDDRAVDPCLDVLRIEEIESDGSVRGPIGSISLFAMHPTVLPNTNRLLGADVFGVVSRSIEQAMRIQWTKRDPHEANRRDPVHAIVNTNEGDVSPQWHSGSIEEVLRIGDQLAKSIWQLQQHAQESPAIVDARYIEVHLPNSPLFRSAQAEDRRLCVKPEIGLAVPKGASDHPTALTFIGDFRDENVDFRRTDPCSSPRRPVLGPIQSLLSAPGSFPEDVPLAVVQIGDALLSFVPAEMTVTAGARLAQAVGVEAAAYHLGARRSIVAGLANGYIQYVTTEEEYRLQHYEGASNVYGIWTARWLAERYALLARSMGGVDVSPWLGVGIDHVNSIEYTSAPHRDRLPTADGKAPLEDVRQRGPRGLCRLAGEPLAVCFWWKDAAPGVVPPVGAASWVRLVRDDGVRSPVRSDSDPDGIMDDRGLRFRTRVHDRSDNGYFWSTVVSLDGVDWASLGEPLIVRIQAGAGRTAVESSAFSMASQPPVCNAEQVIYCSVGQ